MGSSRGELYGGVFLAVIYSYGSLGKKETTLRGSSCSIKDVEFLTSRIGLCKASHLGLYLLILEGE